jgi:glyoxylase-like metal-dependent hydrolase (beta-lactamase superfamily II)
MVGRDASSRERRAWFASTPLGEDIQLLAEPGHVNSFLVLGHDRALLFDTGMGIGSILAEVRALTDLPLLVVNSHHHYDHRGGNAELTTHAVDIAVHPAGMAAHDAASAAWRAGYATAMRRTVELFDRFAELDAAAFFTVDSTTVMRPLPDLSDWQVPAIAPTRALADGEIIDLGGRALRVIHTPGHSPDSLCLLDEATGTLLAGDTLLAAAFWAHLPGSDIPVFADSVARLAELTVKRVLVAHNLRAVLPGSFPAQAAEAFAAVRDSRTAPVRFADPFGNPAWRHDFDGFAILSPIDEVGS